MATFTSRPMSANNESASRRNNHLAPHLPHQWAKPDAGPPRRACPASGERGVPLRGGRRRLAGRWLDRIRRGLGRVRRALGRRCGTARVGAGSGRRAREGGSAKDQHDQQTLHASPPGWMASTRPMQGRASMATRGHPSQLRPTGTSQHREGACTRRTESSHLRAHGCDADGMRRPSTGARRACVRPHAAAPGAGRDGPAEPWRTDRWRTKSRIWPRQSMS
jgi:hypothetical protein